MKQPINGEWLLKLRKRLKLTQQAMADKIGCTHGSYCAWENERRQPSNAYQKILLKMAGKK